jgi:YHS domain-containing protein
MTRHLVLFVATFLAGAVLALAVRSALHQPYAGHAGHVEKPAYQPLVHNSTPAEPKPMAAQAPSQPESAASAHAAHADHAPANPAGSTINTVCPICGMEVDPSIQPAEHDGTLVGFGCRACPPKFAREPERYVPAARKNETVED